MSAEQSGRGLSDHLRPRIHSIGGTAADAVHPNGEYVLYWMRTAVRGHENPALDVALESAAHLDRPVFVYHAVAEGYPYASDRHHRFIIEGARDVARELAERGIGYAFHVERPGHTGDHLVSLAADAALVVTEDMPVAPLAGWAERLAQRIDRPVWAVDTACLVPMRTVPAKETSRAFLFRKANQKAWREATELVWPEVEVGAADPFAPDLPFEPIDFETLDIGALIAECRIDHSVPPVPHTPGGSEAGYARWNAFRENGLHAYAASRNDPLRAGVSRMSAYLHYGQVSPFRLAREASQTGGKGARKYLDELLVWRELAYAFCAHRPDHATIQTLPRWARQTLADHADDERTVLSWEQLALSRTGDALWDAAQTSLRVHGELHNNVRMTWGKVVLPWTRDAEHALDVLKDLNHRYALDGRDPASYGGILWCLGKFDAPFDPERPVFGQVRSRSTEQHAKRLDVPVYAERTAGPAWSDAPTVAVVGAGLAGLACARALSDQGYSVAVFDKGRRPGGRANTRVHDARRFDHGAQYFTIRDPALRPWLDSWLEEGVVEEWKGRIAYVEEGVVSPAEGARRFVGVPGMVDLGGHLATGLQVSCGVRVAEMERVTDGWLLTSETGSPLGVFDRVVVTAPAPQSATLLAESAPELARRVGAITMDPCWAGMVEFGDAVKTDFDAAFVRTGPLAWVARQASKPGRPQGEAWVLHATPEWSTDRLESDRDCVVGELTEAFAAIVGDLPDTVFRRGHLWRYAQGGEVMTERMMWDSEMGVAVCGDWCAGGRVEGAILSGMAAAGRIMGAAPAQAGNPFAVREADPSQLSLLEGVA